MERRPVLRYPEASLMYKVLIVDDEEPVREAVRILGEWERLNIHEIIEAENGKDAIRIVREKQPELVIIDMKMPEMSGPEFLRILELDYPDIQKIIVSGYDSFEFTRQAILSRVTDYLLKPISGVELNSALEKCIGKIEKITQGLNHNLPLSVLKTNILMPILKGSFESNETKMYERAFGNNWDKKYFNIAILRIMSIQEYTVNRADKSAEFFCSEIVSMINEACMENIECFSFVDILKSNQIVILISDNDITKKDDHPAYVEVVRKLYSKVWEKFKAKVIICIGSSFQGIKSAEGSYRSAEAILLSLNAIDTTEGIYTKAVSCTRTTQSSILTNMVLIKNAVEKGSFHYLKSIISDYLIKIKEADYFSFKDAEKTIREFIILMEDIAEAFGVPEKLPINSDSNYAFSSFQEFEKLLYTIIDVYYDEIRKCIKANENFDIAEIKDFIDKNYSQDIKISMFTNKYYLSRAYIMKLFKKNFGCGIHEYIQNFRMMKAGELLNDKQLKILSISQLLGYTDTNYFSKAFKNYYGVSPTDYRLNNKEI
jgi:two-component system, response regulator YesN